MSEKVRTQQVNNDLEKLTHELEKIGLNKERLLQDEQSSDDTDRFISHTHVCKHIHQILYSFAAILETI